MNSLKKFNLLLFLFLTIALTQSCDKDSDDMTNSQSMDQETKAEVKEESQSETQTGNDDATNNSDDDIIIEGADKFGSITRYLVQGDNLIKEIDFPVTGERLEFQKDTDKHQEIWELTKGIIPPNFRSKMSHFMIFVGATDGVAGYVFQSEDDLSQWEMGIAIDLAYEGGFNAGGELAYTIIHEFGHILTLNNTQIDASVSESDCQEYFPGEGCAKKEAYINKTYKKGWADIWSEFATAQESENDFVNFYVKYEDRFVTSYAAVNPAEDIAEVFTTFVTRNGGVNGNSIAEQKIQIMYDHAELLELRDHIRGNGASAKSGYTPINGKWKMPSAFSNMKSKGCLRH